VLYRAFPHAPGAGPADFGGALYVARDAQGSGRHDNPQHYGALYVARAPDSAVAERIQQFRGQVVGDADLHRSDGRRLALAAIDDAALDDVVDLDDPRNLVSRSLRPSMVATHKRPATQRVALGVFEEGANGLAWWSTLEAAWSNVTLFHERAAPRLRLADDPEPLGLDHPAVRAAADAIGVRLER
jgi:hypothetical protein